MATLIVITAIGVALGYFAIAFAVLPRIDLVDATPTFRLAFRVGGIAFFAGCGLTHTHIAVHAAENGDLVAAHELVFHILQFVGVWVIVYVAVKVIDVRVEVRRRPGDVMAARVAQLARSNEDLEQFAQVVSHDLQGPLTTAMGFARLMEKADLSDRDREMLGHLRASQTEMQDLLHGVLRYSSAAGGGLAREPVDLSDVAREVVDGLTGQIQQSGAEVQIEKLPVVLGDRIGLRQVLGNLIGNAIRYGGEEPPQVLVAAELSDDRWCISVSDSGPGIPAAERDQIFEMFNRGTTGQDMPGTGIGLAICKKIVERHGGRIWVTESDTGGARFVFALPDVAPTVAAVDGHGA